MLHLMKFWLRYLMLKITHNYKLCCWLNNWKFFMWLVLCLTFNNSAKSSSNSTFWRCFEILRTSRIQNCHWNSILSRISMRKTGKHPRQVKLRGLYMANIYYRHWVFSPDMPPKYPLKHPFSCKLLFWLIIVGLFEALLSPPDVITRCFRCSMLNIHYIGKWIPRSM